MKDKLSIEYRRRILRWMEQLSKHTYTSIFEVELRGFESEDFWSYERAKTCETEIYPKARKWGRPWNYGYFFAEFEVPPECTGKHLVYRPDTGRESIIYINGKAMGAKDKFHFEIPVTKNAIKGEKYEIFIESYAGHGERNGHVGPVPEGTITVLEPSGKQGKIGENEVCIWNQEVYLLWIEVNALMDIREKISHDTLRVHEINRYLKDFTLIVDFESGEDKLYKSVAECRKHIRPAFECKNGSSTPTMYMIGHSHLDIAWKWPINETRRKIGRTFSNQLALIDEYDEYRYLNPQPFLYELLKENYPDIFSRVKEQIKKGKIIPDGALYVESDTNLPSGESLIRQFMFGKKYFKDEFDVESNVCWLPDAFGYSASFPQIMSGCGVKYFTTSKILWCYNDGEPFPYITFFWQGADGTKVLAHNQNEYNAHSRPSFVYDAWDNMQQKEGLRSRIMPFGYGDGGGGALRDHMEFLRLEKDLEGIPKTKIAPPEEFFKDLEMDIETGYSKLPTYVGELYLQVHRGVYTTQAKTKKGNRKSEISLRENEFWDAISFIKGINTGNKRELEELWKKLLVNQFHDILPGTSIKRVHDEAQADYEYILEKSGDILDNTLSHLISNEDGMSIYNSLGHSRDEIIEIPTEYLKEYEKFTQKMEDKAYTCITVPAAGHTSLKQALENDCIKKSINSNDEPVCRFDGKYFENDIIRVEISSEAEIIKIIDKIQNKVLNSGISNKFRLYRDVPTMFDAWDIDSMYQESEVELDGSTEIKILSQGDAFVCISVKKTINNSKLSQKITLKRGSKRIDFDNKINWKESHKLLKVDFDTQILSTEALHNIQYGYTSRPNHKTRQYDKDRFEVCAQRWSAIADNSMGAALLNDCKYGVSVNGSVISLSLLRSPLAPDMVADKGVHEFKYSFYTWEGPMIDSNLARESYNINVPVKIIKGKTSDIETYININNANIVLDTLKISQDGEGVILRIYDMLNIKSDVEISTGFDFKKVCLTDMLENEIERVNSNGRKFHIRVGNFQVRTLKFYF